MENQIKHRFKVDKLIRDDGYNDILQSGIEVYERIMGEEEYEQRLKDKLLEEAQEVLEATNIQELKEELADVLEVIMTMAQFKGIEFSEVIRCADNKRAKRGGLKERKYLEFVDVPDGNPYLAYYQEQPHKYPEIKA